MTRGREGAAAATKDTIHDPVVILASSWIATARSPRAQRMLIAPLIALLYLAFLPVALPPTMAAPGFIDAVMLLGDSITQESNAGSLHNRLSQYFTRRFDVLNRGFGGG